MGRKRKETERRLDRFIEERWDKPDFIHDEQTKKAMSDRVLKAVRTRAAVTRLPVYWAAAACVVLALGIWWLKPRRAAREVTAYRSVKPGEVRTVHLPDGTTVYLNAFSSLTVMPGYNGHQREVQLSGEAFFEVARAVQRPFIVHTSKADTRVYGTSFDVCAYPNSNEVRVGLQNGRVGVACNHKESILNPGQLLIYDKAGGRTQIGQQVAADMGAWRSGGLVFYKTPLRDVLAGLENKFGVRFSYDSDLNNQTITATFDGSIPLAKILDHLSFVWDIHFQQGKDSIYVR